MDKRNNLLTTLVIILGILVLALGGYLLYDKVLKSDNELVPSNNTESNCPKCQECEKCESNTSQCNCPSASTSCLGEKITSLKKINLTTT